MKRTNTKPASLAPLLNALGECLTPQSAKRILAIKADKALQAPRQVPRRTFQRGSLDAGRACRVWRNHPLWNDGLNPEVQGPSLPRRFQMSAIPTASWISSGSEPVVAASIVVCIRMKTDSSPFTSITSFPNNTEAQATCRTFASRVRIVIGKRVRTFPGCCAANFIRYSIRELRTGIDTLNGNRQFSSARRRPGRSPFKCSTSITTNES